VSIAAAAVTNLPIGTSYNFKFSRLAGAVEQHPGLLQNPRFYFFVVHARQVKRPYLML